MCDLGYVCDYIWVSSSLPLIYIGNRMVLAHLKIKISSSAWFLCFFFAVKVLKMVICTSGPWVLSLYLPTLTLLRLLPLHIPPKFLSSRSTDSLRLLSPVLSPHLTWLLAAFYTVKDSFFLRTLSSLSSQDTTLFWFLSALLLHLLSLLFSDLSYLSWPFNTTLAQASDLGSFLSLSLLCWWSHLPRGLNFVCVFIIARFISFDPDLSPHSRIIYPADYSIAPFRSLIDILKLICPQRDF